MSQSTTPVGGGSGGSSYINFGLKIGFPPGFAMKHKNMRFPDYNITVRDAINFIASKQVIANPEQYVLQISYLAPTESPAPVVSLGSSVGGNPSSTPLGSSVGATTPQASPMVSRHSPMSSQAGSTGGTPSAGIGSSKFERRVKWMDDNVKLSAYPLASQEVIIELRKKYQLVKVVEHSVAQSLIVDVTRPLSELMAFIICKFKLDQNTGCDYRLFHNNIELSMNKDVRASNIDVSVPFFVRDKSDPSSFNVIDDPSLYDDDDDDGIHTDLSLEVPAKSLTTILKEGYLKKQNRKKSWNSRYFILTDKYLFYYKTPHDRRASGIINFKEHIIRISGQPKDRVLELIPKENMAIASASVHTHPGSFLIKFESESEMASWNTGPFIFEVSHSTPPNKTKAGTNKAIFGQPVEKSVPHGAEMPLVITQTMEYIEKKAMDVVGIFRLSGSMVTIEQWKKQYDKGERPNLFEETDPHAISGLLKLYLRELPEPLLTFERYDKFIAAQSMDELHSRLKLIKHLVKSLPPVNLAILTRLMAFLGRVSTHSANNKMQIHNLSTVFGPNLIRERNSTSTTNVQNLVEDTPIINALTLSLIRDYPYIFGDKEIPETKIFARTLYDYNGSDEGDDLIFPQGVTIRVTQQGRDGWWAGEYSGKSGRFPATYVELIPQSPASLLRTKSNTKLSKKKKFMMEMENARNKTIENEKSLQQLRDRRDKLTSNINTLNAEHQQLTQQREVQRVLQVVKQVRINKPTVTNIPPSIDVLVLRLEEYRKSHEDLANVKTTLLEEYDAFANNPKVKSKLESKERELMQSKVDVLSARLDDSKKTRQKSLSSKRNINEELAELKTTIVL